MSINWASVYTGPIGQLLGDLSPTTFMQLMTQGSQAQLSQLENTKSQDATLISAWTTLQSDAQAVNGTLFTLNNPTTFQQMSATSSNPSILTATDSSAQQGSYSLFVDQLAQAEIDQGQPPTAITSNSAALGFSGSFQIYTGAQPTSSLTISSSDTLQQIASAINAANSGVTASTEQLANGNWTLAIQGNTTGAANNIHYIATSPTGTSSPLYQLGLWNTSLSIPTYFSGEVLQSAQNAAVNFGSAASTSNEITSSTNTFTNLVPGLTVNTNSQGSQATITVGPNTSGMMKSIQQFVTDWNQWVSDTQNLAEAGTVTATGTGSGSNYTYQSNNNQVIKSGQPQSVLNEVQTIMGGIMGSGMYQSLSDIGLSFNGSGKLVLNQGTLTNALSQNPSAVSTLFQNLYSALTPTNGVGALQAFYSGSQSIAGQAIAYDTTQQTQTGTQITMLKNQLTAAEQQAVIQYGQWVNQIAHYSQESSLVSAMFNQNSGSTSTGG